MHSTGSPDSFAPQVGVFRRHPRPADAWYTPTVPLNSALHTAHNIALISSALGLAIGAGLSAAAFLGLSVSGVLALYAAFIGAYHLAEYLMVALYNPTRVTIESFMFNPDTNNNYYKAMLFSLAEYAVEALLFPAAMAPSTLTLLGLLCALIGQVIRSLAMVTAKSSFNHYVASERANDHVLVTHGIYAVERHPSYVGFFMWAVGLQIMLKNPLTFVAFVGVLARFFVERSKYEEVELCRMFGDQYVEYASRTPSLIPFLPMISAASGGGQHASSDSE